MPPMHFSRREQIVKLSILFTLSYPCLIVPDKDFVKYVALYYDANTVYRGTQA
jgi:hypothetical protein